MSEWFEDITSENLDAILRYLPAFKSPGFVFAERIGGYGPETNSLDLHQWAYSHEVNDFVMALYRNSVTPTDSPWIEWQDRMIKYYEKPELLKRARLLTLRKLLTIHVRKDRYCDGHLLHMFEVGHLMAILERLQEIRNEMAAKEQLETHKLTARTRKFTG